MTITELKQRRAALIDENRSLLKNATNDLTREERVKFDANLKQIGEIADQIEVQKELLIRDAEEGFQSIGSFGIGGHDDLNTGTPKFITNRGGKALNESGSIRLYAPGQRLSADVKNETPGLDLGSFLRAVVDKPRNAMERQAVQNSVDSSGYTLPTYVSTELIDRLRAANPVIAAGARSISINGLDGTKFVKINGDPDAVWHAELDEEDFSDPDFDDVELKPKTVLSLVEVGRELLQDSVNVEDALSTAFIGSINNAILAATFTGAGGKEPVGLATTITQTEEYPNAGNPDWSHFVKASRTLHDNNVPENGRSFIYAPDVWETLALAEDNQGRYQDAPSFIRDVPGFTSSGVADGESYAGDFSNVVYGWRINITLEQHSGLSARKYATVWLAAARLDIAVFRPKALVRIEEAAAG